MKTWFYTLAAALGFTTLCCDSLLPFSGWVAFHWSGPPSSLVLAGLFDFIGIWLLLAFVLYRLRHSVRLRNLLWAAMLAFAPSIFIEQRLLSDSINISSSHHRAIDMACLIVWIAIATRFYKVFARYAERWMLIYVFLAASGFVLITHALWFGWRSRDLNPPFHDKAVDTAVHASSQPRIIWIVMDELPYQFIFERRPVGLKLPAFDALAHTATVFTAATPPSAVTEYAMPSYLTAITPASLSQDLDGNFSILDAGRRPTAFNQHDTVFQDARDAGYSTAVAGWFMPYCRMLPEVLDRCLWTYGEPLGNGMSADAGLFGNIAAPFLFAAPHLLPSAVRTRLKIPVNRYRRVSYHIQDYNQLRHTAKRLLRDSSLDFVLLHLPVPHLPSMYDASTGSVGYLPTSSFISNLALADRCFAELRAELEESHQWVDTTVVLMGDHGWRGESPGGLHDPAALLDHRQAYVVKLAGQTSAQTIDTPFNAIRTRALLRAMMQHIVRTPSDLRAWTQSTR